MRRWVVMTLIANPLARADTPTELHEATATEHSAADDAVVPVEITPALKLSLDALDLATEREDHRYALDRDTRFELHGDWFDPRGGTHDAATHAWQARARFTHAFGATVLAVDLGAGHVVSDIAEGTVPGRATTDVTEGTYYDATVSLTRTFRLSRTVTGFVSLAATLRHWRTGDAPLGEGDGATLMLWLGAHF